MSLKPFAAAVAFPALLMACQMESPAPAPQPVDLSSCSADAVQSLIGENVNAIDTSKLARSVRIIPPNSAVTMDYSAERLNIETDASGVILRMTCG